MACDLETIQTALCASDIGKITSPIQLWQVIAQLSCEIAASGGGGGGGGSGQIKVYTSDPNSEGVLPDNTALPALAYKSDGTGSIYQWVVSGQTWM